jgi:hypothetical protein
VNFSDTSKETEWGMGVNNESVLTFLGVDNSIVVMQKNVLILKRSMGGMISCNFQFKKKRNNQFFYMHETYVIEAKK